MVSQVDPLEFVISKNLKRRHLNESQRAMIAARLANMQEGRPRKTASFDAVSQSDAATMLNVSRPSVQRAKAVQENAPTETEDPPQLSAGSSISLGTSLTT